ncbi:hypothetical protein RintRC_3452 [Richelia intracellularis]|nr:hypothetical protein RintRC_3452 [Richelia intracellularis]
MPGNITLAGEFVRAKGENIFMFRPERNYHCLHLQKMNEVANNFDF